MAFDALPGMKINADVYKQTFIAGDYFAVFEDDSDMPDVYKWSDITLYTEEMNRFVIGIDRIEYIIPKNAFESARQLIQFRTLAESQLAVEKAQLKMGPRIVPPKYNYQSAEMPENVFSGTGTYVEKEINAGSIAHVYGKFKGPIISLSVLAGIAAFVCFWLIGGNVEENWIYYAAISVFLCIGIIVLVFLVFCIIAKHRYSGFLKHDISTMENIVFIIAPDGFGAVEQCVYTGKELIPWSNASYFYETKYSVAIVCRDRTVCCIPKRFFQKSSQNDLVDFIAGRVEQH